MAKQVSELNWKKRLLVISYQNEDDLVFIQTTKFISNNTCHIVDRNLEIIFFENFKNKQIQHLFQSSDLQTSPRS